jgi:uncharacterized coiled-coil protein SlyX
VPHGPNPSHPDDDYPHLRRLDVDDLREAIRGQTMQSARQTEVISRMTQAIVFQTQAMERQTDAMASLDRTLQSIHAGHVDGTQPVIRPRTMTPIRIDPFDRATPSVGATPTTDHDDSGDNRNGRDSGGAGVVERRRRTTGSTR